MTKLFYTGLNFPILNTPTYLKLINTPTISISFYNKFNLEKILPYLDFNPIPIFTSKNSVRGFEKLLNKNNIKSFIPLYCYCIGESTGKILSTIFNWDINTPKQFNSLGIIHTLKMETKPLLFVTAKHTIAEILNWASDYSNMFLHLPVYETTPRINSKLQNTFQNTDDEMIIFTSPSTISGFLLNLGLKDLSNITSKLISIGPTTSQVITNKKGSIFFESKEQHIIKLLNTVLEYNNSNSC